ncbi:YkgJ family cysteine cluster protein [Gloeothece verrucosa]|uniref:YkgJ family cysteine cluster protein n=1 Tax=Gloeothece verrucosa (strain PCC 7822) TaxID=497965 RepID=E0U9X9_GLOV7|nr:YkgJ family cysteine cluster protein [Gloeothece verrucosa]ADN15049.1 protein of unknown function UPF0153 [Gloeothece verrucosa PCC 7822]
MATWRCVKQCGACCHLAPEERPELDEYLSPEELNHYLSLVGEGGWCIHFDHETRECKIYEQRPIFCRVTPDNFERMYGVCGEEFNEFAIECCQEQIEAVYGADSAEMDRYNQSLA